MDALQKEQLILTPRALALHLPVSCSRGVNSSDLVAGIRGDHRVMRPRSQVHLLDGLVSFVLFHLLPLAAVPNASDHKNDGVRESGLITGNSSPPPGKNVESVHLTDVGSETLEVKNSIALETVQIRSELHMHRMLFGEVTNNIHSTLPFPVTITRVYGFN